MSWTARLAEKGFDAATRFVNSSVHGMPHSRAEQEQRNAHDRWARTAVLGQAYFTSDAKFDYVGDDHQPRLICTGAFIFTRSSGGLLYTEDKRSSWEAWWRSAPHGLTTVAPPAAKLHGLVPGRDLRLAISRGWDTVEFTG